MIASARRPPRVFRDATPSPRLHSLARLALARIDQGHDRLEAVMAALTEAVDAPGLPSCYDHLSPLQRELVLVLWGNGHTRLQQVSRALPERRRTVIWRVAMDLCRDGVLTRVRKGTYCLAARPPALRPRPGCHALDISVRRVLASGPKTINDLSLRFGVSRYAIHRRLAPMLARREIRRIQHAGERAYALTEGQP